MPQRTTWSRPSHAALVRDMVAWIPRLGWISTSYEALPRIATAVSFLGARFVALRA